MANQPDQVEGKNFFERHPKKTLGVLVVLAVLVAAFIADRLLALKIEPQGPGVERYVRLRELSPLTVERFTPKPEVFDAEAGSQPRQVVIRSDEQGFVMPSRVHDRPDLVLAFLGGSTTECRAVPEEGRTHRPRSRSRCGWPLGHDGRQFGDDGRTRDVLRPGHDDGWAHVDAWLGHDAGSARRVRWAAQSTP